MIDVASLLIVISALYIAWEMGWLTAWGAWTVDSSIALTEYIISLSPRPIRAWIRRKTGIGYSPSLRAIGRDPYDY